MIGYRWGFIFGVFALVFSLMLGIISGVRIFHIVLRSASFFIVFFGIGTGVRTLIDRFFPELLEINIEPERPETPAQPGSLINITLGNTGEYAVPEKYGDSEELGNIEDLFSGVFRVGTAQRSEGIDRKQEESYNKTDTEKKPGETGIPGGILGAAAAESFQFEELPVPAASNVTAAQSVIQAFSPSLGEDTSGLGGLPDLDSMAMAFSSSAAAEPAPILTAQADIDSGFGSETVPILPLQSFEDEMSTGGSKKGKETQAIEGDFHPKELAMGIRTVLSKDK